MKPFTEAEIERFEEGCNADNISDPPSDKEWLISFLRASHQRLLEHILAQLPEEREGALRLNTFKEGYKGGFNSALTKCKDIISNSLK